MSINYIEKGQGLHAAIAAAGHWLRQVDRVWQSSDDASVQAIIDAYTLDQAKAERMRESLMIAKRMRDAVVADISSGEMASWHIKRAEAQAYATSGNAADAPLLLAEAQARGITLDAMLAKVSANAQRFQAAEAAIGGADGRHRDAISALSTFAEVAAYDLTAGWPAL